MSSEIAITTIGTVKKKLDKYIVSKQNDKVKEYLEKLHNTLITPELLRKTQIDILVGRLALDIKAPYYSTAKSLLKKWQDKNRSAKPSNVKTISKTSKAITEKKLPTKRKSDDDDDDDDDDTTHSNPLSESLSSDDYQNSDRDQSTSSSSTKKRKVLSMAEYVANKKPKSSPPSSVDSTQNKFSDTEIKEIYTQFNAKCEELVASAPKLTNSINQIVTSNSTMNSNRKDIVANGHAPKVIAKEQKTAKHKDFWDDDDDDDDDNDNARLQSQFVEKPQPIQNKQIVVNNSLNTPQVKKSTTSTTSKSKSRSMVSAIASSIAEHPQPLTRSTPAQSIVVSKKPEIFNFLRPKQERQAIYSGKRVARTSVPSLQDLCVEVLKDNVEDACHTHLNRLPYDVVKPIVDSATPEQLKFIIDNNPDYVDDVEPLWQKFCSIQYKDTEPDECETYYELYWRKFDESEQRLHRITELAKRKKAESVEIGRQTKSIHVRQTANRHVLPSSSSKISRQVVGLPLSKTGRGQTKVKKSAMPPLLKKTLRAFNGKN